MTLTERQKTILFFLLVFASRIPFLFNGFGSEEDAWALPMVAERIAISGQYEVSRLPGHPFQEIVYSRMWWLDSFYYNLLTALISTAGILAFVLFLKRLNAPHPWQTGMTLAFTPVVYIHSTNAMDYTWALGFSLLAAWLISRRNILPAAAMVALAAGCRITALAMLVPCTLLLFSLSPKGGGRKVCIVFLVTGLTLSSLVYLPVFLQYGPGFFSYYEHFPIPVFLKNFYKGSIAVWGLPGTFALAALAYSIIRHKAAIPYHAGQPQRAQQSRGLLLFGISGALIYLAAFIRLPLKAAFMLPFVPFLLTILFQFTGRKMALLTTWGMVLSCFTFGVNLADEHRGSSLSPLALTFTAGRHPIAVDPLNGLVTADRSKRINRTAFATLVLDRCSTIRGKTAVIAGWWLADLQYLGRKANNPHVVFRHYIDEPELRKLQASGYRIYYLEDQDEYNDLRYRKKMTRWYATLLEP